MTSRNGANASVASVIGLKGENLKMDNLSPHKAKASELELILERWERRHEWRLLSKTIPRSLLVALLISLIAGAVGYFRFRLSAEQLALITAGFCALSGILNILYTLLFPRSLAERARYFRSRVWLTGTGLDRF